MTSRYERVDRGAGSRAGQLLRHTQDPQRWQVRVYIGRTANGRKRYRSEVVHGRKRDAEKRLTELLHEKNQGKLSMRTKVHMTVAEATTAWLKHKRHQVTARSLQGYITPLELYVLPVLGSVRLQALTLHQVTSLYDSMRSGTLPIEAREAGWRGNPLSARTVQIAHTALSQVLSHAVLNQWINRNVLSEVRGLAPAGRKRNTYAMSVAQRSAFLNTAVASEAFYAPLYRTLMDTGLRPGEAAALTWADIDFAAGHVSVTKAVTRDKAGAAKISTPKTAQSRRTVPLFGISSVLLAHRDWQAERGLLADEMDGLVFTTQAGTIIKPWTFGRRELSRVAKAAGITENVTLYTFRHTFATLHLASGTPLKVVSGWLGHSTIKQTADTYQHASTEVFMDYAERHTAWLEKETLEGGVFIN